MVIVLIALIVLFIALYFKKSMECHRMREDTLTTLQLAHNENMALRDEMEAVKKSAYSKAAIKVAGKVSKMAKIIVELEDRITNLKTAGSWRCSRCGRFIKWNEVSWDGDRPYCPTHRKPR